MSKLTIFDFRCDSCGTFEGLVKPDIHSAPCPTCHKESKRIVSAPRLDPKMGLDPDFPSAYAQWGKKRNKRAIIDRQHYASHGTDRTPGADTAG